MIVNLRDAASAILLLPLCFGGGTLGMFFFSIIETVTKSGATTERPDSYAPAAPSTGIMLTSMLMMLAIAVAIPAVYFFLWKKLKADNPRQEIFGGLSLDTAFVLGAIAYLGPALALVAAFVAFSW